jgi:bifunctional non-homologous end joining protein LigD
MPLTTYRRKRNFKTTSEPAGNVGSSDMAHLLFVVQKHRASHLHYDFRLEWKGVLLSWAVPKGPSLDPSVKRLAMQTEDHPLEYANFEGVIPEGEYGAGTVMVWDQGTWHPDSPDVDSALQRGDLKFTVHGQKLKGAWVLVRTPAYGSSNVRSSWLLMKHHDQYATKQDILVEQPRSVLTHRLLADIANDGGGDIEKAADGDPVPKTVRRSVEPTKVTD